MKFTSLFVAIGLTFCQLAAAAPRARSADSISVQWWNQIFFTGDNDKGDAMPSECYGIEAPFRGTIQSLQVDSDSSCIFFTLDTCEGLPLLLNGTSMGILPPLYTNNIYSYKCQDNPTNQDDN